MNKSCSRCGVVVNVPDNAEETSGIFYDLDIFETRPCTTIDCSTVWSWRRCD